jgi:hypothetical protein
MTVTVTEEPVVKPTVKGIDYSRFDNIEDSDDEKVQPEKQAATEAPVETPHCYNCHKEVRTPLRCSVCKKATYCSQQCQKDDWRYHKRSCKKPEAPRAKSPKRETPAKEPARPKTTTVSSKAEVEVEDNEDITWYRHREWKPTTEPKKEFKPTQIEAEVAASAPVPTEGSVWNAAGTFEDKDVTATAQTMLREILSDALPSVDVAGGILGIDEVKSVEGDASKPVIRGTRRHLFDLSFTLSFSFKWMDMGGQQKVGGSIAVNDFTNDCFTEGDGAAPLVHVSFKPTELLDGSRRRGVEEAIGARSWPPHESSLMAKVASRMAKFSTEFTS